MFVGGFGSRGPPFRGLVLGGPCAVLNVYLVCWCRLWVLFGGFRVCSVGLSVAFWPLLAGFLVAELAHEVVVQAARKLAEVEREMVDEWRTKS